MSLTAELGTRNSMPGNIALASLPPTGSSTGGAPPKASAASTTPTAHASTPRPS